MKKLSTLLITSLLFLSIDLKAQFTNVYDTGFGTSDGWTGWTVASTGTTFQNVNGVNLYSFTLGTVGQPFSIELSRQFNITGTPINIGYILYAQDATIEVLQSYDGTNWTSVQSNVFGSTYGSASYLTTYAPTAASYYLKLKLTGTIGSMQNATFDSFTIDASTQSSVGLTSVEKIVTQLIFAENTLTVKTAETDYSIAVYDLTGSLVASFGNEKTKDLSFLNSGIYFVSYSSEDEKKITKKIVVSK